MKHAKAEEKKKGGCLKTGLIIVLVLIVAVVAFIFIFFKIHEDELLDSRFTDTAVGQDAPEFEVTTVDGETVSKSSLLEDKEVLVVVLFATWCGPCESEFPDMDKVYQKYQDKMSMIAIDVDTLDTEDSVKEYADTHKLSFPIAMGNDSLGIITTSSYPTTLIIDRNGKIGMWRVGSIPTAEKFEKVVTAFMGDEYQDTQIGYYTFVAYADKAAVPGVEFTVTSESGTETYTTDEEGYCDVYTDKPENLKVQVTNVPEGYAIDGSGELESGTGSTFVMLPVTKE